MTSFVYCENEKKVYMFPSENKLGWAIWLHSNSLIKSLTSFEDDAEIRLLNFLM